MTLKDCAEIKRLILERREPAVSMHPSFQAGFADAIEETRLNEAMRVEDLYQCSDLTQDYINGYKAGLKAYGRGTAAERA